MKRLRLTRSALEPIAAGHPWVYRDGVVGSAEPGELVALVDHQDREVAAGLFDTGAIAVRVLGKVDTLARTVVDRVRRADGLRFAVVGGQTNCWRVVNGAGDGLPGVVVDRYDELAVLRLYSAAWEPHVELLVDALGKLGWVGSIARRLGVARVDGREGLEVLRGSVADEIVVEEHGVRLLVRPHSGQKTGLFLDQRENRRRLAELAPGRRVLNLFGYNGGFSVYCALAGAARVHTVDISAPALLDAEAVFALNGLDSGLHTFERADVFSWTPPHPFDLVICDPPSLTHGKSSDRAAGRAYRDLNRRVGGWVTRDGLLMTASCTARLDFAAWERAVREGLRGVGRFAVLSRREAPADHPVAIEHAEGRYLKALLLRRLQ